MLAQRLRCWASIKPALGHCVVLVEECLYNEDVYQDVSMSMCGDDDKQLTPLVI